MDEEVKVRIPNTQLTLKGRSRAAVGTCIRVCETGWLLDCGVGVCSGRPSRVFLTHTHLDHVVHAPAIAHLIPPVEGQKKSVKKRDQVTFHLPRESVGVFDSFFRAAAEMDKQHQGAGTSASEEVSPYIASGVAPSDEIRISGEWI